MHGVHEEGRSIYLDREMHGVVYPTLMYGVSQIRWLETARDLKLVSRAFGDLKRR